MNSTLIASLISAGAALVVCLINNHFARAESDKKNEAIREESDKKHEANIMLISYRLEQLEKKVDVHNNVIERTYALEKRADVTEEKIKVANNRIADLEKGGKE